MRPTSTYWFLGLCRVMEHSSSTDTSPVNGRAAWCQPGSGMQRLRMSDLPLDVRWLVSRERYQKRGVRSCIMRLRILTRATARTLIPFSKRICESLPLVSSLLLSVIAHCSVWSPTQLLSKDFFDLSLLYGFIFLIPNSAVHFIIWT